jgi:hypothetical protein
MLLKTNKQKFDENTISMYLYESKRLAVLARGV